MKKVLVITYYWPPSGGSGVQRWVKFAKYLPAEGWQPVVYAPEHPSYPSLDPSLAAEIPKSVQVIRRPIFEPFGIYRRLFGKGSSVDINEVASRANGAKGGDWKSRLSLYIRSNFFIPDARCLWIRPSARFLKNYLKEHPVDVIVSTGPPHSVHLIARSVARATGIPWVADFRDPWTKMYWFRDMAFTKRSLRRHRQLEKQVLDDATVVLSVTPYVQKDFEAMTHTPVAMITNGFDESDYADAEDTRDEYFNITHTGVLPVDGNPDVLWKVLGKLCKTNAELSKVLRIRLVGNTDASVLQQIQDCGLGANLVDLGYQAHKVAVEEQKNACLLILPVRKQPESKAILSGKLFEYLAARRRILGFGDPDGAMAEVLNRTGAGAMAGWDDEKTVETSVLNCWKAYLDDEVIIRSDAIDAYSRKVLTHRLSELLESLTT